MTTPFAGIVKEHFRAGDARTPNSTRHIRENAADFEEFAARNREFGACNEEFGAHIEEFAARNKEFAAYNEGFAARNKEFAAYTKELAVRSEASDSRAEVETAPNAAGGRTLSHRPFRAPADATGWLVPPAGRS